MKSRSLDPSWCRPVRVAWCGMAEVIHLKPGETPPADEKYILFECIPSGEMTSERTIYGSLQRVPDGRFDAEVAKAPEMADFLGYPKVYVRGRPA